MTSMTQLHQSADASDLVAAEAKLACEHDLGVPVLTTGEMTLQGPGGRQANEPSPQALPQLVGFRDPIEATHMIDRNTYVTRRKPSR